MAQWWAPSGSAATPTPLPHLSFSAPQTQASLEPAEVRREPARTFRVSVTLVLDFGLPDRKRQNAWGV